MSVNRMKGLAEIAEVIRDRELAKVRTIMTEMTRLRGEIAQIEEHRLQRQADAPLDLARLSGAEMAWMAATEDRVRVLQSQLARLSAGHAQALGAARTAFGRADVARRLSDKLG